MTNARKIGFLFLLLSTGISVWWGFSLGRRVSGGPIDFQAVYYGSRALILHHNPYSISEMETLLRAERGESPADTPMGFRTVTLYVNLPTTLLFIAPFAVMPLAVAQTIWVITSAIILGLAGCLIWNSSASHSPFLSWCMIAFLLANCQILFATGNTAGIVVGLCVIGAWCIVENRFVTLGILCMAVSLAIKPHDAGLVWLFFLCAGGAYRKTALRSGALAFLLAVPAVLWLSLATPHWIQDWRSNMRLIAVPGGLNDPGPNAILATTSQGVLSLQSIFSIFKDDPRFYNLATFAVCGVFLLIWASTIMRSNSTRDRNWLALGAVVPIALLVTYHRIYDAKLLMLAVPACIVLWMNHRRVGMIAVVLTAATLILNSDLLLTVLDDRVKRFHLLDTTMSGKILIVLLGRANHLALLVLAVFNLWTCVRYISNLQSCIEPADHAVSPA